MAVKVGDRATTGTNQMMMVLWDTDCIAVAATSGVQFAYQSQLGEYVNSAVDGYQSDARVVLADLLKYGCRSKVVVAGGYCMNHGTPLRSKLVTVPPESSINTSVGGFHLFC